MADVVITRGDGRTLSFSSPRRGTEGEIWDVEVALAVPGMGVQKRVASHYATAFDELIGFFDQLAARWKGWDGEIIYESLEGDLKLVAAHRASHVDLGARLRRVEPPEWCAEASVTIDPGKQITAIANELRGLLQKHP